MLRSLRTRLAALVFAITVMAVGFVLVYVVPSLQSNLREQKLEALEATGRRYVAPIRASRGAPIEEVRRQVSVTAQLSNARVTLLRVSRGTLGLSNEVIDDSRLEGVPPDLNFDLAVEAARTGRTVAGSETGMEGPIAEAALPLLRGAVVERVVVFSMPLSDVEANVALVRRRILVAGAIALALALAGGLLLASRLTRRIRRLERAARRVAAGDLSGHFVVDAEDELGQLAVALDDMQRQLGQLDSARKRFIATASHELRTPIFSLGGFLELIQDEDLDPDTRDAFLVQVREQVERLKKLAVDLLDLSKLEAGSLELRPEPTDLGTLARAVSDEFRPALSTHESELALRLEREPVEAEVDPERVAQIVRILIDNALTHTPPGTAMVMSAEREDGVVRLAVRDFGEGIRRPVAERIFEPFYSADDGRGSGLGLAIARELADRMDGELTVEALAGRTTFTLELPA